jgi:hypothetical protein
MLTAFMSWSTAKLSNRVAMKTCYRSKEFTAVSGRFKQALNKPKFSKYERLLLCPGAIIQPKDDKQPETQSSKNNIKASV